MSSSDARSLAEMFRMRVAATPDRVAFLYPADAGWATLTWKDVDARVRAIAGGLLGYQPDDERLRESLDAAAAAGLAIEFKNTTLRGDHHPNTTRIHVTRAGRTAVLTGSSLGAGRIMVTAIDGFPVEITGAYTTLVAVAKDVPGIVASVAGALADDAVNLATMRVSRRQRGGDAIHIYELDHAPTDEAMTRIRAMPVMKTVRIIERVS